jgi:hypothetical protein
MSGYHTRWARPEEAADDPERIATREALAFGKALYDIRTELGLTVAELATRAGIATRPATFRDAQLTLAVARPSFGWAGTFHPPGAPVSSPRPPTYCSSAKHNQDGKAHWNEHPGRFSRTRTPRRSSPASTPRRLKLALLHH